MPSGRELATHKALGAIGDQIDTTSFQWRFLQTLCWKAGLALVELPRGVTTRTFALNQRETTISYTPTSDLHVAMQERGEAPITENVHELSPLDAYRETAGLTSDEDDAL